MPTYEYRCTSCENRFDVYQRIDDEPLRVCQRCGGELRKVFHPAGIVFRGSGFYATDSRKAAASSSRDGKEPAKSGDGAKKGTEGGTSAKQTETKPARSGEAS